MTVAPRLSIGLPVYNGQNYLAEALDALLGQSYPDFELIISDNASTDGTEDICRRYAKSDPRIRYTRQRRNIGLAPNHALVVDQAGGTLFKWAAHDDLCGSELLTLCVEGLDEHPEAVLCQTDMAIIDHAGDIVEEYDYRLATSSSEPSERFRSLLFTDGGDDLYGVIRRDVLRRIPPLGSFHNAGRTLAAELALQGPFHHVPELMFFRRDHPGRGDRLPTIRAVCANLDPHRADHSTARLLTRYVWELTAAMGRAELSSASRRRCYHHLVSWMTNRTLLGHSDGPTRRLVPGLHRPPAR